MHTQGGKPATNQNLNDWDAGNILLRFANSF